MISVTNGTEHEKDIASAVAIWCMEHFKIDWGNHEVNIDLQLKTDCWGTCVDNDEGGYDITVSINQSLRDFVATVVHEMVHVKQYITGKWAGTGEREANKLQYKLADKMWKEGIV